VSYFNAEQRDHMESLSRIPPERLCWCGWNLKGECASCPADRSAADKLAASCELCGADPGATNKFPTLHRQGCSRQGQPHRPTLGEGESR
jgi:hypothetical protein